MPKGQRANCGGGRAPPERDRLSALPPEILVKIFVHLDPRDLAACSQLSRRFRERVEDDYLWHKLLDIRFGRDAVADEADAGRANKAAFVERSRLVVPAGRASIVHMSGHYWEMVEEKDGLRLGGGIAHLRNVCWFHIEACMKGVPAGRYYPVWRLYVEQYARHLSSIRFSASTDRGAASAHSNGSVSPSADALVSVATPKLETQQGLGWFDLVCPVLDVGSDPGTRFFDVHFFATDYSGFWKNGLFFAHITLRRVVQEERSTSSPSAVSPNGSSILQNIQEYVADMGSRIFSTFTSS